MKNVSELTDEELKTYYNLYKESLQLPKQGIEANRQRMDMLELLGTQ